MPVAPGLMAPSGVLMVGLALVLRDLVQRRLGLLWAVAAILAGTLLSALLAPAALVVASGVAFLLSELADLAVFTPLQRRRFLLAVLASSIVGLVVDSAVFLYLAFGNLDYLAGQVVGKAWMVLLAMPHDRLAAPPRCAARAVGCVAIAHEPSRTTSRQVDSPARRPAPARRRPGPR